MSVTVPSSPRVRRPVLARAAVRTKIMVLIGVFALFSTGLGVFAAAEMNSIRTDTARIARTQASVGSALTELTGAMWSVRQSIALVAAYPADGKKAQYDKLQKAYGTMEAATAKFATTFESAVGRPPANWDTFTTGWANYRSIQDAEVVSRAMADDRAGYAKARDGAAAGEAWAPP